MCNRVKEHVYTVFFAFAGIGGGAIGFQQAAAALEKFGLKGRFRVIGAFDFDAGAAADFERLTGVPCEVVDVRKLTVKRLRALCPRRPDVVFGSAPCKGASPLLGNELAETEKYQEMNTLMLIWTELLFAAWGDDPPLLVINENVPRLASRAKDTVKEVVKLHQRHGYVVHAGSHDCGEVGGLAQHRVRFLLVARLARKVTSFLYQPPKQRVRGCGEVIGPLPLPSDPAGGDMHILTDICVTNWTRLALIPPGGDWRDIEGALQAHEARNAHWSRYHTARFDLATPVVAGSGSNGAFGVGDERVSSAVRAHAYRFTNELMLHGWGRAARTVTGATHLGNGSGAVVDVRLTCEVRENSGAYGVLLPARPAYTVTAWGDINNGRFAYADTRALGAVDVRRDVAVILVGMLAPEGADFTADVEARVELDAPTVAPVAPTKGRRRKAPRRVAAPCGRVRRRGGRGALFEGVALVADPRVPRNPEIAVRFWATRLDQPPIFVPVLATSSGYWHRPLTVWERCALQGFPLYDGDGRAIVLSGANISAWSERIGNAVPPPTAKAVAEQMLLTLLHAEAGVFVLSSGGGAWVQPGRAPRWMRVLGVEDLIPRAKRASRKVVARCGGFAPIEHGDPWASWTREKGVSQAGGLLQ